MIGQRRPVAEREAGPKNFEGESARKRGSASPRVQRQPKKRVAEGQGLRL